MKDLLKQKQLNMFFLWGFLVGAVCFLAVFGFAPLNIFMDGWLMKGELDLKQHYVGWLAFRYSPWTFPIGMTDKLAYPYSMSILYTDSIPLFAVIFKLLAPVLPETFHYFGIYILLSFSLNGAFASRLIFRLTSSKCMAFLMSAVFALSYPMLNRSFYHSSLTAQWLILLGFELWFSGIFYKTLKKQAVVFFAVAFLATSLHTYFLPMIFGIMCGGILEYWLVKGVTRQNIKGLCIRFLVPAVSFVAGGAFTLYIFGAFSGPGTAGYYVGDFVANLNSLFNPRGASLLFKELPLVSGTQGEGAAYLGAGVMLMLAFAMAGAIAVFLRRGSVKGLIKGHPRRKSLIVMAVIFVLVSIFPVISLNDKVIFTVPCPDAVMKLFGIFRSNGRFMWPVMYLVMLAACTILAKAQKRLGADNHYLKRGMILITVFALIFQLIDLLPYMITRHEKFDNPKERYVTEWDKDERSLQFKHFVSFQKDAIFGMAIAYYAVKNEKTVNRFYFARDIDEQIFENSVKELNKIREGKADSDTIYVFDRSTYEECKKYDLHFYASEKCIYGVKDKIEGKKELTEADIAAIRFP